MTFELIAEIANIALALSLLVGLIFGIAQVRAAARDRRERLTLETLRAFQTREFAELINMIVSEKFPTNQNEFRNLSTEERVKFVQYGQQMESLGMLVAEHMINIDLVDKTLGAFVTTSWEKYKPIFTDLREKTPDPFLGEYFQWLAELIERRMKENPRRPFHEERSRGQRLQ
jgi:hypothetical protein